MKNVFKLFEELKDKTAVFSFGRMNPPTRGHEMLIDTLFLIANNLKAEPFLFLSRTQDNKKNPLSYEEKIKYIKLGIPKALSIIVHDETVRNPFDAVNKLGNLGFDNIVMVVGSDRVAEFQEKVNKYINHPDKKLRLPIKKFIAISAGDRDPDNDDVSGISSSKLRFAAQNDDFHLFNLGTPSLLSHRFSKEMFDVIKKYVIVEGFAERKDLPQIKMEYIDDFIKELRSKNIDIKYTKKDISELRSSQKEINSKRVDEKVNKLQEGSLIIKPFLVSKDNYIIDDGHHQLLALKWCFPDMQVGCYDIDLCIKELLYEATNYSKSINMDLDGNIVDK